MSAVIKKIAVTLDIREQLVLEEEKVRLRGSMDKENLRFREQSFNLEEKGLSLIKQRKQKLDYNEVVEPQFMIRWRLMP